MRMPFSTVRVVLAAVGLAGTVALGVFCGVAVMGCSSDASSEPAPAPPGTSSTEPPRTTDTPANNAPPEPAVGAAEARLRRGGTYRFSIEDSPEAFAAAKKRFPEATEEEIKLASAQELLRFSVSPEGDLVCTSLGDDGATTYSTTTLAIVASTDDTVTLADGGTIRVLADRIVVQDREKGALTYIGED